MKSLLKKIFYGLILLTVTVIALNLKDGDLNPEVIEGLTKNTTSSEQEERQCGAVLGLFVDEKLDSEIEGKKLLTQIQNASLDSKDEVAIPTLNHNIQEKKPCSAHCNYSESEMKRLVVELSKQAVFLARFKKIIEGKSLSCRHPATLLKLRFMDFRNISRHQIIEYRILAQQKKLKEAQEGLMKMNSFFENTLLNEKYSLVEALVFVKLLSEVRETLKGITSVSQDHIKFNKVNYEKVIDGVILGELQEGTHLLTGPIKFRFLFLKNETFNDHFKTIKEAVWHPCIGQKDIPCEFKLTNPILWLRNPMGKYLSYFLSHKLPDNFRKLKNATASLINET